MDQPPSPPSSPPSSPDPSPSPRLPWERGLGLPLPAFQSLARALRERGAWGSSALRECGRAAGAQLLAALDDGETLPPDSFWERIETLAAPLGLGRPEYSVLAPGVGSVTLTGGIEAIREDGGACHFSAGWIGGLLTETAGEPVAVLEVRCAALGPGESCRFLVGAPGRLRAVRRRLSDGVPLARALAADDPSSSRSAASP